MQITLRVYYAVCTEVDEETKGHLDYTMIL